MFGYSIQRISTLFFFFFFSREVLRGIQNKLPLISKFESGSFKFNDDFGCHIEKFTFRSRE
jgi:hypothetical protein